MYWSNGFCSKSFTKILKELWTCLVAQGLTNGSHPYLLSKIVGLKVLCQACLYRPGMNRGLARFYQRTCLGIPCLGTLDIFHRRKPGVLAKSGLSVYRSVLSVTKFLGWVSRLIEGSYYRHVVFIAPECAYCRALRSSQLPNFCYV
jgi:hypothetical protein